jgi:hypothetical protein
MAGDELGDTPSTLAPRVPCTATIIRSYCKKGLLDYVVLPTGMYLLKRGQEGKVRAILKRNLANRGKWKRTAK